jgi:hypothetical protein
LADLDRLNLVRLDLFWLNPVSTYASNKTPQNRQIVTIFWEAEGRPGYPAIRFKAFHLLAGAKPAASSTGRIRTSVS